MDQLVARGCVNPGCNHKSHGPLFIHAQCHLESPLEVYYEDGVFIVACLRCHKPVLAIAV
jgi:hypothetical protein